MGNNRKHGFTLVEVSIALVIIGLVIGGILVGRDLISAAAIRSQIAQVEQFNTATNTFKLKYGDLPGDIPSPKAVSFGFKSSSCRNGDGVLAGCMTFNNYYQYQAAGETNLFWVDLGKAGLINGNFIHNTNPNLNVTGDNVAKYLPRAKIDADKYIYVWSGGSNVSSYNDNNAIDKGHDGKNYFALSAVPTFTTYNAGGGYTGITGKRNTISVIDAYNIDQKMDDGLPNSGSVFAYYAYNGGGTNRFTKAATLASATSCYDNGNVNGATQKYSLKQNNGSGTNCALNFRFR